MIILPRKVADSVKHYRDAGCTNSNIMARVITMNFYNEPFADELYEWANKGRGKNREKLMEALVNGYEVEKTPEEKILDYYHEQYMYFQAYSLERDRGKAMVYDAKIDGIKNTLNMLGIEIEGINKEKSSS